MGLTAGSRRYFDRRSEVQKIKALVFDLLTS